MTSKLTQIFQCGKKLYLKIFLRSFPEILIIYFKKFPGNLKILNYLCTRR